MQWTPARLLLAGAGSAFVFAGLLGIREPNVEAFSSLGITIGGPVQLWHWVLGLAALGVAFLAESDATARASAIVLGLVSGGFASLVPALTDAWGLRPFDAAAGFALALVLLGGAAVSRPSAPTPATS